MIEMIEPFLVTKHIGQCFLSYELVPGVEIQEDMLNLRIDLIMLEIEYFDVILSMD